MPAVSTPCPPPYGRRIRSGRRLLLAPTYGESKLRIADDERHTQVGVGAAVDYALLRRVENAGSWHAVSHYDKHTRHDHDLPSASVFFVSPWFNLGNLAIHDRNKKEEHGTVTDAANHAAFRLAGCGETSLFV